MVHLKSVSRVLIQNGNLYRVYGSQSRTIMATEEERTMEERNKTRIAQFGRSTNFITIHFRYEYSILRNHDQTYVLLAHCE